MMKNGATISDIAKQTGVSSATVSYVLNETPGKSISQQTRRRVLDCARALHYVPNHSAQHLKRKRSDCIAVRLTSNLMDTRFYSFLQGIRAYLEPRGYRILLCNDEASGGIQNYVTACLNHQADGVLYIPSLGEGISEEAMELIRQNDIPMAYLDYMGEDSTINSVSFHYFNSTYLRARHMAEQGIRKILYVRPTLENEKETLRQQGVYAAAKAVPGLEITVAPIEERDYAQRDKDEVPFFSMPSPYVGILRKILEDLPPDGAVLCAHREIQAIVTRLLFEQELLQPGPLPWYQRTLSYHFPHHLGGAECARSLVSAIENPGRVRKLTLEPELDFWLPNSL